MAKTALKVKQARKPKFGVRAYTRCQKCGRPKAVYRKFGLCRVCLREMAHKGELPGITKSLVVSGVFGRFGAGVLFRATIRPRKLGLPPGPPRPFTSPRRRNAQHG